MSELIDEIARLENILNEIQYSGRYENDFDRLYKILKDEFQRQGGESAVSFGNYPFHLEQTIDEQAAAYINAKNKKSKKGSSVEFDDFVRNFERDISDQLIRLKIRASSTSGQKEM